MHWVKAIDLYIYQITWYLNGQCIKISIIYFNEYINTIINLKNTISNAIRINHKSKISLSNSMGITPKSSILSVVSPYHTNLDIIAVLFSWRLFLHCLYFVFNICTINKHIYMNRSKNSLIIRQLYPNSYDLVKLWIKCLILV